jgi:hypothetical protein
MRWGIARVPLQCIIIGICKNKVQGRQYITVYNATWWNICFTILEIYFSFQSFLLDLSFDS